MGIRQEFALGPIVHLKPGGTVEHTEHWTAHKNVHLREFSDAELDSTVLPLVGTH